MARRLKYRLSRAVKAIIKKGFDPRIHYNPGDMVNYYDQMEFIQYGQTSSTSTSIWWSTSPPNNLV